MEAAESHSLCWKQGLSHLLCCRPGQKNPAPGVKDDMGSIVSNILLIMVFYMILKNVK